MPRYDTESLFERKLKKHNGGENLKIEIAKSLEKFGKESLPRSLDFKPISGVNNVFSIRVLGKYKGWRILFRKINDSKGAYYSAFDFDNHDIRRQGN